MGHVNKPTPSVELWESLICLVKATKQFWVILCVSNGSVARVAARLIVQVRKLWHTTRCKTQSVLTCCRPLCWFQHTQTSVISALAAIWSSSTQILTFEVGLQAMLRESTKFCSPIPLCNEHNIPEVLYLSYKSFWQIQNFWNICSLQSQGLGVSRHGGMPIDHVIHGDPPPNCYQGRKIWSARRRKSWGSDDSMPDCRRPCPCSHRHARFSCPVGWKSDICSNRDAAILLWACT